MRQGFLEAIYQAFRSAQRPETEPDVLGKGLEPPTDSSTERHEGRLRGGRANHRTNHATIRTRPPYRRRSTSEAERVGEATNTRAT